MSTNLLREKFSLSREFAGRRQTDSLVVVGKLNDDGDLFGLSIVVAG